MPQGWLYTFRGNQVFHRLAGALVSMVLLTLLASTLAQRLEAASAPSAPDESDRFFSEGQIPQIKIKIPAEGMEQLRREARQYVKATVIEGDRVYENVGVHLKGAAGSFRAVDDPKPAFTLNFDKFQEGQKFHGLDKLHLNNSVQDRSYLTELLCSELFLKSGVPATRVSHAVVTLNGQVLGLFVLKEGFGKSFLKRHFANPRGNLYDGGFLKDITEPLERISGSEPEGQPDLTALAQACRIQDPKQRLATLESLLDVDRFISFIAMEMMVWHWDGYLMKKNNYRVYHDPESKRLVFLPHGMDQMFWEARGPIVPPNQEGMVASALLSTATGKARYKARAAQLTTNVFHIEVLTNRIESVRSRLRPVLASLGTDQADEHDGAVLDILRKVTHRAEYLTRVLTGEELKPLVFDSRKEAPLKGWKSKLDAGMATFSEFKQDGRATFAIEAVTPAEKTAEQRSAACLASYRTLVSLEPGRYALVGRVKAEDVAAAGKSVRGSGVGLRVSGQKRQNALTGTTDWQELSFEFNVNEVEQEVELVCDLRALSGKALFDVSSLKLRRLSAEPSP